MGVPIQVAVRVRFLARLECFSTKSVSSDWHINILIFMCHIYVQVSGKVDQNNIPVIRRIVGIQRFNSNIMSFKMYTLIIVIVFQFLVRFT
jgi:hypothetical protein